MAVHQLQKVNITHDAIIDVVIAQPALTYREIANLFGYTPEGIGIIVRSDAFKARLEVRKGELVDPLIAQTVEARLTGLAHASIDILQRKLAVSDDGKFALQVLDSATKAAGYGARPPPTVQNSFVVHLPGPAANSGEWAAKFSAPGPLPEVIENGQDLSNTP